MDYRIKAVSAMVGVSDTSIRNYETELALEHRCQANGPKIRIYSESEVFQLAAHRRSRQGNTMGLPRQVILSTYSPMGGVAKTTLTTELSVQLSFMGFRVLVVDLDPQGTASVVFGYEPQAEGDEAAQFGVKPDRVVRYNISNLLCSSDLVGGSKQTMPLSEVIKMPYGNDGPHLIPADVTLASFNWWLMQASNRERRLLAWVNRGVSAPTAQLDLRPYDFIIFDNAASQSALSQASLVAADYCITPVRLDALSAKALAFVRKELEALSNSDLSCPGLIGVPTFFESDTLRATQVIASLSSSFLGIMTPCKLRRSELFPRSLWTAKPEERAPVSLIHPLHQIVREDIAGITKNILDRIKDDVLKGIHPWQ